MDSACIAHLAHDSCFDTELSAQVDRHLDWLRTSGDSFRILLKQPPPPYDCSGVRRMAMLFSTATRRILELPPEQQIAALLQRRGDPPRRVRQRYPDGQISKRGPSRSRAGLLRLHLASWAMRRGRSQGIAKLSHVGPQHRARLGWLARIIVQRLSERWHQPVVRERAGGRAA